MKDYISPAVELITAELSDVLTASLGDTPFVDFMEW